jgi:hypothetical protein
MPFMETWPKALRSRVRFYGVDSMAFYMERLWHNTLSRRPEHRIDPEIVLVDGNHDYEFALFDIQCAARLLAPSGFILVDNVSQAGPYQAVDDFAAANPGWTHCRVRACTADPARAYDPERTSIPDTDFEILRAPPGFVIGNRPKTFGEMLWLVPRVTGVRLSLPIPMTGTMHIECVLRGFSEREQAERVGYVSTHIAGGSGEFDVPFPEPIVLEDGYRMYRVEPWLTWRGEGELRLANRPILLE